MDAQGAPVAGVIVQLLDSAGAAAAAAVLSDEGGRFVLSAPAPGRYRLQTMRLGFRVETSQWFDLGPGEDVSRRLTLIGVPTVLPAARVVARYTCGRPVTVSDTVLFQAWDQARAALTATQMTGQMDHLAITGTRYRRTLDPGSGKTVTEQSRLFVELARQPWSSAPTSELRRAGFVITQGDSVLFRAPGLEYLASDAFIADHCLRFAAAADGDAVGIEFEPASNRRSVSEIRGTLRLRRTTSELQALDFTFTNVDKLIENAGGGGRVEFAHLGSGGWVIPHWDLRMPVIGTVRTPVYGRRSVSWRDVPVLSGMNAVGGDVSSVTDDRTPPDTLWKRP